MPETMVSEPRFSDFNPKLFIPPFVPCRPNYWLLRVKTGLCIPHTLSPVLGTKGVQSGVCFMGQDTLIPTFPKPSL